jgi:hypothetical protein
MSTTELKKERKKRIERDKKHPQSNTYIWYKHLPAQPVVLTVFPLAVPAPTLGPSPGTLPISIATRSLSAFSFSICALLALVTRGLRAVVVAPAPPRDPGPVAGAPFAFVAAAGLGPSGADVDAEVELAPAAGARPRAAVVVLEVGFEVAAGAGALRRPRLAGPLTL